MPNLKLDKRFACFSDEQQMAFNALKGQQKKYVYFRANGHTQAESYALAGYKDGKNASQAAHILEKRNPIIRDLVLAMAGQFKVVDVYKEDSEITKKLREAEKEKKNEFDFPMPTASDSKKLGAIQAIEDNLDKLSVDDIQRLNFYRDIASGKIKTVKTTRTYAEDGVTLKSKKVEEVDDVSIRMAARRELDKLLGKSVMSELGQISAGSINIMIVDSKRKEEIPNTTGEVIDIDKVETVDGEQVLVVDEVVK